MIIIQFSSFSGLCFLVNHYKDLDAVLQEGFLLFFFLVIRCKSGNKLDSHHRLCR